MKNLTIRHRVLLSIMTILAATILLGGISFLRLDSAERKAVEVQTVLVPSLSFATQLATTLASNFVLTEDHAAYHDVQTKRVIETKIQANAATLIGLSSGYGKVIQDARDKESLSALLALGNPYAKTQEKVLQLSAQHRNDEALALITAELRPIYEEIQAGLSKIEQSNRDVAIQSIQNIRDQIGHATTDTVLTILTILTISSMIGFYLRNSIALPMRKLVDGMNAMRHGDFTGRIKLDRSDEFGILADDFNRMADDITSLVGQVQKSGIQVSTSVTKIAATARQQQATTSEIAATTVQVGTTSKEISATSKELVKTVSEVAVMAAQTADLANNGQTGLGRMADTMRNVMAASSTINAKLAVLNEQADNINQVVTTITKVADQTNLLSLNAAIEAEKAGESGRGFAVVATEIRRLADQTGIATYDIEQIIKEIQAAIAAGVMGMDKFSEEVRQGMQDIEHVGTQLTQIIQQVHALVPRFETVNEGMQAQAIGASQISESLAQLTDASQQTVESIRQSTAAIDNLNQVSGILRSSVSRFKLEC